MTEAELEKVLLGCPLKSTLVAPDWHGRFQSCGFIYLGIRLMICMLLDMTAPSSAWLETIVTLAPGMKDLRPELEDHFGQTPDQGLDAHVKEVIGQLISHKIVVRVR